MVSMSIAGALVCLHCIEPALDCQTEGLPSRGCATQTFVLSTPKPDHALLHGCPPAIDNFFVKELLSRIKTDDKGRARSMSRQASSR